MDLVKKNLTKPTSRQRVLKTQNYFLIFIIFFNLNCHVAHLPMNIFKVNVEKINIFFIVIDHNKDESLKITTDRSRKDHLDKIYKENSFTLVNNKKKGIIKSLGMDFKPCFLGHLLFIRGASDYSNNLSIVLKVTSENLKTYWMLARKNIHSSTVTLRELKIIRDRHGWYELKNEGCYYSDNFIDQYLVLSKGKHEKSVTFLTDDEIFLTNENIKFASSRFSFYSTVILPLSATTLGGFLGLMLLFNLFTRTKKIHKKKKLLYSTLYGLFCFIITFILLVSNNLI